MSDPNQCFHDEIARLYDRLAGVEAELADRNDAALEEGRSTFWRLRAEDAEAKLAAVERVRDWMGQNNDDAAYDLAIVALNNALRSETAPRPAEPHEFETWLAGGDRCTRVVPGPDGAVLCQESPDSYMHRTAAGGTARPATHGFSNHISDDDRCDVLVDHPSGIPQPCARPVDHPAHAVGGTARPAAHALHDELDAED